MWNSQMSWKMYLVLAILMAAVGIWNLSTHDHFVSVLFLFGSTVYLVTAYIRARSNPERASEKEPESNRQDSVAE